MEDKSVMTGKDKQWETKLNKGTLFQNQSENPSAPDYTGDVNVDGVHWKLALWKNKKGYLGIEFTNPNAFKGNTDFNKIDHSPTKTLTNDETEALLNGKKAKDEFNDDIPF
mgnify:CR=1 FL=1